MLYPLARLATVAVLLAGVSGFTPSPATPAFRQRFHAPSVAGPLMLEQSAEPRAQSRRGALEMAGLGMLMALSSSPMPAMASGGATAGKYTTIPIAKRRCTPIRCTYVPSLSSRATRHPCPSHRMLLLVFAAALGFSHPNDSTLAAVSCQVFWPRKAGSTGVQRPRCGSALIPVQDESHPILGRTSVRSHSALFPPHPRHIAHACVVGAAIKKGQLSDAAVTEVRQG